MDRDSQDTRSAGARETRRDGQRVRVTEKEGEKRSSELREKERGIEEKEGEQKRENTVEGKRERERDRKREGCTRHTSRAARRVASPRVASRRVP